MTDHSMDGDAAGGLTAALGDEVGDAYEETFLLYAQPAASRDLGFVDARAPSLSVALGDAGRVVTLRQSPAVLASSRAGGTTGAVLWRVSSQLASWLASPQNPLLAHVLPRAPSSMLELGCGISPLNALALRRRVAHYVLSDQAYVQKLLCQNLADALDDDDNESPLSSNNPTAPDSSRRARRLRARARPHAPKARAAVGSVVFRALDWETDAVTAALAAPEASFDAVLSSDCVFNEALVAPLVQTCVDVCALRRRGPPCVCIVAQQLRSHDVFAAWLVAFLAVFRVWRVPDAMLPPDLRPSAGFVVHVAILRGPADDEERVDAAADRIE